MRRKLIYGLIVVLMALLWGWQAWALKTGREWISDAHWHFYVACFVLWIIMSVMFIEVVRAGFETFGRGGADG